MPTPDTLRDLFYQLRHGAHLHIETPGNTNTRTPPLEATLIYKNHRYHLEILQGACYENFRGGRDEPGHYGWTHSDLIHDSIHRNLPSALITAETFGLHF